MQLGPMVCECCGAKSPGGIARSIVLDEPGAGAWVLWMLADGWSLAEHSDIAVCPEHQSDPLLKTLRFAE